MDKSNVALKCPRCGDTLVMKGEIKHNLCLSCMLDPSRGHVKLKEFGFPEKIV